MMKRIAALCLLLLVLTFGTAFAQEAGTDELQAYDVEQLFGSWTFCGSQPEYDRHSTNFPLDHRMRRVAQLGLNTQLYVSRERVTLVKTKETSDHSLFQNHQHALDATDVRVAENSILATLLDVDVRIFMDSQGSLCVQPLLTEDEKLALSQGNHPMTGEEPFLLEPMFMDVYGEAPQMKPGTYHLEQRIARGKDFDKQQKKLAALLAGVGDITFGDHNTISVAYDDKLYEGALVWPDPYTCADKQNFAFFSFEEQGYTIGLGMGLSGEYLILRVSKKGAMLVDIIVSDALSKLPGTYRYSTESGESEFGSEHQLTIGADWFLTQDIAGESHIGRLELYDILDERRSSWNPGVVVLGETKYEVHLDDQGPVRCVMLYNEKTGDTQSYFALGVDYSEFICDPSTRCFVMGYSIATNAQSSDHEEMDRLFNTFNESEFYIAENWERVVFRQRALECLIPGAEENMLFVQDVMDCEIPVTGLDIQQKGTAAEVRTLHLDMHGHVMDFVCRSNGEAELITGIYQIGYQQK